MLKMSRSTSREPQCSPETQRIVMEVMKNILSMWMEMPCFFKSEMFLWKDA